MTEQNQEGLTLVDLKNLLAIVDYAATQGAFKGWETIKQVVAVRDKLASFIVAAEPKQPETELQMFSDETTKEPALQPELKPSPEQEVKKKVRKSKQ